MKYRYLRIAFSAVCGVVCLLLVVLWVRSATTFDRLRGTTSRRTMAIVVSYEGRLSVVHADMGYVPWTWPTRDSGPVLSNNITLEVFGDGAGFDSRDTDLMWPNRTTMGFGAIYGSSYPNIPNWHTGWHVTGLTGRSYSSGGTGIIAPHWFPLVIALSFVGVPWIRWRFSLRTLLIATTLVAVGLGLIAILAR
jgi:hypothetical protein